MLFSRVCFGAHLGDYHVGPSDVIPCCIRGSYLVFSLGCLCANLGDYNPGPSDVILCCNGETISFFPGAVLEPNLVTTDLGHLILSLAVKLGNYSFVFPGSVLEPILMITIYGHMILCLALSGTLPRFSPGLYWGRSW